MDKRSLKQWWRWLLGGGIILIIAAVVSWFLWLRQPSPFPTNIRHQITYSLYYPRPLPDGFAVSDPPRLENNIVNVFLTYDSTPIIITEQPRPDKLPPAVKLKDLKLKIGEGYVAAYNERPAGVLLTDKTLVVISSSAKLEVDPIVRLMKALVPAN